MSTKKLQILTPIVTSINGKTGDVTIDMDKTAVGLDKVDNTSDADKPISTATKIALDGKQDKITAKGLLRGDGTGNIAAVDGSFLAYEPIADVEATTPIDADTLNGKTYDYINSTKQDKLTAGDNISIDNNVVSTKVYPCNPNLLDNWYFGNPVNQRGQTSYAGTGYGLDRWYTTGETLTVEVTADGVKLYKNAASANPGWVQALEAADIEGMTTTVSLLYKGNGAGARLRVGSAGTHQLLLENVSDWTLAQKTFAAESWSIGSLTDSIIVAVQCFVDMAANAPLHIRGVKMELGDQQTLAHQDSSGNWILNEIPNKEEELIKCITSTADSTDTYANKVIATTNQLCKPNLLKNWCFLKGHVVNQRGQTSYSTSSYGIDMWKGSSNPPTIKLADDGLTIANTSTSTAYLNQYIENTPNADVLSALVTSVTGTAYIQAAYTDSTYSTATKVTTGLNTFAIDASKAIQRILIQVNASSSIKLQAIKLECGDVQTLARNGVNDNWVLNELPDYSEQLALCQRYFITYGGTTINFHPGYAMATTATIANTIISTPVTMRTTPTVSFTAGTAKLHDGADSIDISSIKMNVASKNILYAQLTSTGLTKSKVYAFRLEKGKINFSAEL